MIPNVMKIVVPNKLYCRFGTYDSKPYENGLFGMDDSERNENGGSEPNILYIPNL